MKKVDIQNNIYTWNPLSKNELSEILSKKKITLKVIRLLDIIFSFIGLIILFVPFIIVSILIKLDSKGPVFFKQKRVGLDGKVFNILKFRSMSVDQVNKSELTMQEDERITKVGKWLRKFKIDELPQLINVLKGDMSLVGPRPEVPKYVALYDESQRQVLRVRPGVTDEASIQFIDETKLFENVEDAHTLYVTKVMPVKIGLNSEFIRNISVVNYFKTIIRTFISI